MLPPIVGLAIAAGLAAVLYDRRGLLVLAALLGTAAGGTVIGLAAEERARHDCRAGWESGARVEVTALAIGYLPARERGSVRVRPESAGEERCEWASVVRVWADGPVRPGLPW